MCQGSVTFQHQPVAAHPRGLIAIPHRPCLLSRRPSISPGLAFQQQPILPSGKEPSWQLVQDCEVMTQFSSKSNWEGTVLRGRDRRAGPLLRSCRSSPEFQRWEDRPPHNVCLLGTGSDVFCGRLRMTTSDPAHINILMSITHYKATEFSLSLFFSMSGKEPRDLA